MPRELVHKTSLSEVLLTEIQRLDENHFVVGAQWPRWHVFYRGPGGRPDSMLLAETLRQSVILLAHSSGVPLDRKFLMPHLVLEVSPFDRDPQRPTEVTVGLDVVRSQERAGMFTSLEVSARFMSGNLRIGTGSAAARILDARTYQRFRSQVSPEPPGPRPARALDAAQVGHGDGRHVLLGASQEPSSWPLVVDIAHPVFFDHPLDHVPGMLLVEAARQAIRVAEGRPDVDLESFAAEFNHIVELWYQAAVNVVILEAGTAHVEITAGDTTLMSFRGLYA
ncbi:ScbA/BarX family gamma-butyrolactone biosynthesis protein [Arthrobacter sp. RCC_34]|uniref:ScbA/BarX family gamma-butyrolactone biosynthesis protein n=1 Tax=Arthrobacter sp. RCC_34 TaxID=3239230 RepID=UPI0035269DBB